jgi:pseudo-rSAM protein
MKRYWLTLHPDVFLWQKEGIMLYNAKTHQYFAQDTTPQLKQICNALENLDNLYSVDIEEQSLKDPSIGQWIDRIIETDSGYLTEQTEQNLKPVSFYPFLKIQDDIYRLKWEHEQNIAGRIIQYLREISFYLNPSKQGSPRYYKQMHYPLNGGEILPANDFIRFIQSNKINRSVRINLIGDLASHPNFNDLRQFLISNTHFAHLYVLLSDYSDKLKLPNSKLHLICDDCAQISDETMLKDNSILIFPVRSCEEYEQVSELIERHKIEEYEICPLFDGANADFFSTNVYTTEEDFNHITYSKREIFAHQALNTNFFGKLVALPDGAIYSNLHTGALGNIQDPIYDLIFKELVENQAWRMLRDQEPCSNCIYQYLCPSPSTYELLFKTPNLCKIKP